MYLYALMNRTAVTYMIDLKMCLCVLLNQGLLVYSPGHFWLIFIYLPYNASCAYNKTRMSKCSLL